MNFAKWLASLMLMVVVLVLIKVSNREPPSTTMENYHAEKVVLKTIDGQDIVASYNVIQEPKGGGVFVHMMPATKESWSEIAGRFAAVGLASIAIDLRGHGESSGGPRGYERFTDEEHQKSILDVDAAVKFLFSKGILPEQLSIIGASIGANLALKYIADHHDIKTAILLSAGLNYRGVAAEQNIKELSSGQRVFLISAEDDGENAEENKELYASLPEGVEQKIEIFPHAGHGTTMLENQPGLVDEILDFIE